MENLPFPPPVTRIELPPPLDRKKTDVVEKVFLPSLPETSLHDRLNPLLPLIEESLASVSDPQTQINDILNQALPPDHRVNLPLSPEETNSLLRRDLEERALDWICIDKTARAKIGFTNQLAGFINREILSSATDSSRTSDVDQSVLLSLEKSIIEIGNRLTEITEQTILDPHPNTGLLRLQSAKQLLCLFNAQLAALSVSTEKVSPGLEWHSAFHSGILQGELSEKAFFSNYGITGYSRSSAGSMGLLLVMQLTSESRVPRLSPSSNYSSEIFASGMSGLSSVYNSLKTALDPELLMTSGFYFELPIISQLEKHDVTTLPADDRFHTRLTRELGKNTEKPLVIFAQPFGSGLNEPVFDLARTLKNLRETDSSRPVFLVLDTTMHGMTLEGWQDIEQLNSSGKDVTLIQVQSLLKHSQMGMDSVPGGFAVAYGSHPEIIRSTTSLRGAVLPEYNAAFLYPFNSEIQTHRIQRAGRNAEYLAGTIQNSVKDNPFVNQVYYSPNQDPRSETVSSQYSIRPPFLYITFPPLISGHIEKYLNLPHYKNLFPETGNGTSYGFDGTRWEIFTLDDSGSFCVRLAAGQESVLQLMSLTETLTHSLNDPELTRKVKLGLREEMDSIIHPFNPKERALMDIYYQPSEILETAPNTKQYINQLKNQPPLEYLRSQLRGHRIVADLSANENLAQRLDLTPDQITSFAQQLDNLPEVRRILVSLIITRPDFLREFRSKLSIFGKVPSEELAYHLAQTITDPESIKILFAPIAKKLNKVLKDIQPQIETELGTKLPFTL
jgi:cystathionine beta-lyase/cystathionine gamma-synthase